MINAPYPGKCQEIVVTLWGVIYFFLKVAQKKRPGGLVQVFHIWELSLQSLLEHLHLVVPFLFPEFEVTLLLLGLYLEFNILLVYLNLGVGVYSEYCADEGQDEAEYCYDRRMYYSCGWYDEGERYYGHSEYCEDDAKPELSPFPGYVDVSLHNSSFTYK